MKACYTVKSHLTRPQTLTAVKVSKEQPPQPCAFDTPLRARLELGQKHLFATPSFMLLTKQSSGNCQKEGIHGVEKNGSNSL